MLDNIYIYIYNGIIEDRKCDEKMNRNLTEEEKKEQERRTLEEHKKNVFDTLEQVFNAETCGELKHIYEKMVSVGGDFLGWGGRSKIVKGNSDATERFEKFFRSMQIGNCVDPQDFDMVLAYLKDAGYKYDYNECQVKYLNYMYNLYAFSANKGLSNFYVDSLTVENLDKLGELSRHTREDRKVSINDHAINLSGNDRSPNIYLAPNNTYRVENMIASLQKSLVDAEKTLPAYREKYKQIEDKYYKMLFDYRKKSVFGRLVSHIRGEYKEVRSELTAMTEEKEKLKTLGLSQMTSIQKAKNFEELREKNDDEREKFQKESRNLEYKKRDAEKEMKEGDVKMRTVGKIDDALRDLRNDYEANSNFVYGERNSEPLLKPIEVPELSEDENTGRSR